MRVRVLQTDKQPPRKHLGGTPEMLPLKLQVTTPLRLQGLSGVGFTQSLQRPVRPDCPVRCHKCSWPAIVTALAAPSPPPCHLTDSRNRGTDLGWRAHSETPVPRSARPPHSLPQVCLAGHRHGACRPQPATLPSERFRKQSDRLQVACTVSFAESAGRRPRSVRPRRCRQPKFTLACHRNRKIELQQISTHNVEIC